MRARSLFGVAVALSFAVFACATGSSAVDEGGGGGGASDAGKTLYDANYNIVDGEFIPPDAAPHGGVEAGVKDAGQEGGGPKPIDSGTPPPPTSDKCPSGNTALYNAEWFSSSTPCTPDNGDCDPGDCCFDRSLGSGDPYCITP